MAKNYGWRDLLNAEEKGLAKPSKNSTWRELLEYERGDQGSGLSADYFNETVKQGTDTYNRVATQAGNLAQRYKNKGYIDPKRYDAQRGATDRWLKQWQDTFDNLQSLGYDVSSLSGISEGYQQAGSAMDKIDMSRYAGAKDERDYYNKRLQDDIERGEVNPANISTIGPRVAGKAQREKAAETYKGKPDSIFSQTLHEADLRNQAENEAAKRQRDEQLKKLQPYLPEYPNRPADQPTTEPMQPERYNAPRPYDPASAPQVELKKEYGVPQSLDPSRRIASAGSTDFSFDRPQNWSSWMEQVQQAATPAPPKTDSLGRKGSLGRKVEDISITGGIIRGNTIHNLPAEAQEYYETTTSEGAKARTSRLQAQHDELMAQRNRVFQDISDMDRALGHAPSPQDVEAYRNFVNTQVMRPKAAETLADLDKQLSDLNEQITNTNNQATILELKENYKGFEDDPIATQKFNADMYKAKFGAEWDKMSQLEKVGIIAGDAAKMGMYTAAGGWYALSDIMGDVLGMPKNEWSQLNKELRANLQSEMTLQAQKMGPATEAVQALISATVDTIPAIVMAVLSGGATVAATATKTLATAGQGLWAGVRQSALKMFKSPNFIFNLLSEGGRGYEEERAKGYSPIEAAVNASLKAFPNAMIEQGGIQSAMQRPNVIKELVRTGLEEGGEEITQGTVGNAYDFIRSGKIMQPELDDIISWDNPEAVISGKKMLEEGAMGAAVGGILGGTQAGVRKIGDAVMGGAEPAEVDWGDYWKKIDAEQDAQIAAKQQQEAAAPVVKNVATTVKEVAERLSLDTAAADKLNADLAASKLDEATFSDAYARAYEAGIEGIDAVYLTASDAVKKLSPDLAKTAYEAGIKAYEGKEKPKILSAAASARMSKLKPGEGSVTMHESVQQAKLAPYQNKQIEIWKTAAKVLGLNAVMFQSATDAEGNIVAGTEFGLENGKYEYSTGRIWIDVNAQKKNIKDNAQAIILKTAGHELTHFVKHMSPDLYREYSRAVTQALANAGQNIDTLINEQIARSAAGSGGDIGFGVALEEVIANTSDLMLRDSQVINNIHETSPDLFARMHKWVKDFAQRVRDAFERFRGTESVAQKAIMQGVEGVLRYTEDLVAKFDAALGDAAGIAPATETMARPPIAETAKEAAQAKPVIPADAELSEGSDAIPQNGNNGRVFTNDNTEVAFHYALVPAGSVVASNTTDFAENPAYPQDMQPRERADRDAYRWQVENIARQLNPARLGASPEVNSGAPMVGPDMLVENGNGRTIALQMAIEKNGEQAKKYNEWLRKNAAMFGLSADDVKPDSILVRVNDSNLDRNVFAEKGNEPVGAQYSASETAKIDARKLTPALLRKFDPSKDYDSAANGEFARGFISAVLPEADLNEFIGKDGRVSQTGVERMRNALFQLAYNDGNMTARLSEATEGTIKNIVNAMVNVAPRIALTDENIKAGQLHGSSIAKPLVEAYTTAKSVQASGQTVEVYVNQTAMVPKESPEAFALLEMFAANRRSGRAITAAIKAILDRVEMYGDPNQVQLPGMETVTPSTLQIIREGIADAQAREDAGVRFQMRAPVEETAQLIAVHNLNESQLMEAKRLGGFAMPSIAVIKAGTGHSRYGDISVVVGKDTINPARDRRNKVYGGDAWTPSFPQINHEISEDGTAAIRKKVSGLLGELYKPFAIQISDDSIERAADNNRGSFADAYENEPGLMGAYLKSIGEDFIPYSSEPEYAPWSGIGNQAVKYLADKMGGELQAAYNKSFDEKMAMEPAIRGVINEYFEQQYSDTLSKKQLREMGAEEYGYNKIDEIIRGVGEYLKTKGAVRFDKYETGKMLRYRFAQDNHLPAYRAWLDELFADAISKRGIRNNADIFTPSGNRRGFDTTHWQVTLDNVVKAMRLQSSKGSDGWAASNMFGVATKNYKTLSDIRKDIGRLRQMDDAEYQAEKDEFNSRLIEIAREVAPKSESNSFIAIDRGAEALTDAARAGTKAGMLRVLNGYKDYLNVKPDTADKLHALVQDIMQMPTEYFEAKPERAVGFDEARAIIHPDSISPALSQWMDQAGVRHIAYEAGNEQARLDALNSPALNDIRFQERAYAPPMYSKMEQEIEAYKGDKLGADSVVKYLKGRGVKADEIRWSGIVPFLQGKKSVSKAELLAFVKGNELNITTKDTLNSGYEVERSGDGDDVTLEVMGKDGTLYGEAHKEEDGVWWIAGDFGEETIEAETEEEVVQLLTENIGPTTLSGGTKFEQYKAPGGANYREVLFTVPDLDGNFQSAHWDEENVLAHARLQDFTTKDGKPVLFVEEVQSDWHEKGREEGYAKPVNVSIGKYESQGKEGYPDIAKVHDGNENFIGYIMPMNGKYVADAGNGQRIGAYETEKQALDALAENEKYRFSEVPEAPFATTWHEYVLKRTLRMAAEQGADYMAWTTGKMQAERYSLEKTLSRVVSYKLDDSHVRIGAFGLDGGQVSLGTTTFDLASAQATFGKELGTTIFNGGMETTGDDTFELKGQNLTIGGAGMKAFYDIGGKSSQNIPRFLNKYGAQWGAKISEITLKTGDKVPAIEINDAMKESVLYEGQVLYQERDSDNTPLSPQQAEYFKDSKARDERGRLLKVYHGTKAAFTMFRTNYGAYFTAAKKIADGFAGGKGAGTYYLNMKAPYVLDAKGNRYDALTAPAEMGKTNALYEMTVDEKAQLAEFSKLQAELQALVDAGAPLSEQFKWYDNNPRRNELQPIAMEIIQKQAHFEEANSSLIAVWDLAEWVKEQGKYDGIILKNVREGWSSEIVSDDYIALSPEQIKEVTNLTPTSSPDIRYQERTDDPSSAREILSTNFEQIAVNDAERSLLKTYQGRVKELNAMEQAVGDARTQIQAIESAEGFDPKAPNDRLIRLKNNVKTLTDKINRADKKLLTFEKAAPLKNVLDREVKKVHERQSEIRRQQLTEYREARATTDAKRKLRDQIIRGVKKLNDLLVNESDKRHIPERLKGVVIEFMQPFLQDTSVFYAAQLDRLRDVYEAIGRGEHDGEADMQRFFDEDLAGDLRDMALMLDGRRLSQLTEAELETVLNVVSNLDHMIINENSIIIAGRREEISGLSNAVKDEHRGKAKDKRLALLNGNNPVAMIVKMLSSQNIKPVYFFKNLGGVMKRLFDDIRREGQSRYGLTLRKSREYFIGIATKHHYWDWAAKKGDTLKIKTAIGDDIELTREQALSLYAISKREKTNIQQKASHLKEGGFVFTDAVQVTEYHKGIPVKYTVNTAETHPLNETDVEQITQWLTNEQRAFADDMVAYLSTDMADLGNEASMKLYGIRKYLEKYYFPYKSSQNFLYRQQGQGALEGMQNALRHRSFTKRTVQFANNPIVLDDFTKTWGGHVESMVMYNSMVVPLENFNRVYNYRDRGAATQGIKPESVKSVLQAAYGRKANEYIEQLIDDLNGGVRPPKTEALTDKMIGLFKKGAVFANLSVVVQQPSAIMRAMALIDPKHFLRSVYTKADNEEMLEYSGVAVLKEMGRFDVGLGMGSAEWITRQDRKQLNAAEAITDKDTRDDMLAYLPRRADEITWTSIWRAVKNEIAAEGKHQRGTPEFMAAVTERFEDVIDYTQVYDSVLARSEMMRAKSGMMKSITAFMSEPTTSYNMLYDAFANRADKGRKDHVVPARALAAFTASIVLNSLLKALVMAARDDDESKTYVEKYVNSAAEGIIDGMNPVGMVPIFRDILSIIQGYDVNRADMALITDLYRALDKANSDRYTGLQKIEGIVGAAAAFLGVPVKNVWRDGKGIYGLITSKMPISATTGAGIKNALMEALPGYDTTLNAYYRRLYDAINDGDMNRQAELTDVLTRKGKEQKTIDAGLRKLAREAAIEGAITPSKAMEHLSRFGVENLNGDIKDLYDANVITREEADALLLEYSIEKMDDAAERYKTITKWDHDRVVPEGEKSDYRVMDGFLEAAKTGKNLRAVVTDYTNPEKYGYEKSYLAGQIKEAFKPEYIKAGKRERASMKGYLLNAYVMLGYDREDRSKAIDKWLKP